MTGPRRPGTLTAQRVVFLTPGPSTSFTELAAQLRNCGFRTVLVTLPPGRWTARAQQATDRLVFHEVWPILGGGPDRPTLDAEAARAVLAVPTVDVHADDTIGVQLASLQARHGWQTLVPLVAPEWYDKRWLADRLSCLGIPAPRVWDHPIASEYPVVVKRRVTTGGQGVRICASPGDLAQAWAELGGPDHQAFAQQFVRGPTVSTTGVAVRGEVVISETFVQTKPPGEPTAPARGLATLDRPDLAANAAAVVQASAHTGIFETEQVIAATGEGLLVDFNPRLPGNWAALHEMGSVVFEAYQELLRTGSARPRTSLAPGREGTSLRVTYSPPWGSVAELRDWWRYSGGEIGRRRRTHGLRFASWARVMQSRLVMVNGLQRMRRE